MADTLDTAPPGRRRRSDARRSIDAILNAARTVLGERPDASMEDIATTAGVTRQTVYAHFPSRDALVIALIDAARAEGLAALEAARLDTRPPAEALGQFLDISWQLLRRYPLLFDPAQHYAGITMRNRHGVLAAGGRPLVGHRDAVRHPRPVRRAFR